MEIVGNAVIQKDGTLILPQEVIQRLELKFGDECECQRKSEPSANQYLSHLCERILEPPTPKVTANT